MAKTSKRKLLTLQRTAQAVQLRLRGKSFSEIGAVLGITKQSAYNLIAKHFAETNAELKENTEQLRQVELARLEELHARFAPLADPEALAKADELDPLDKAKKAADVVLKAAERRAKLLGLDAPSKSELSSPGGAPLQVGVFAVPAPMPMRDWATAAQQACLQDEKSADKLLASLPNHGGADEE